MSELVLTGVSRWFGNVVAVNDVSMRIGPGVTTLGIPIACGVIIFTIVITGLYVRRANSEYDRLTAKILEEAA